MKGWWSSDSQFKGFSSMWNDNLRLFVFPSSCVFELFAHLWSLSIILFLVVFINWVSWPAADVFHKATLVKSISPASIPCVCPQEHQKYFVLIDEAKLQQHKSSILFSLCVSPAAWSAQVHHSILKQIMRVIILSWAYSCWHGYWQRLSQYFNKKTKYRKYSRVSRWIINKMPWRAETASQHRECITVRHTT